MPNPRSRSGHYAIRKTSHNNWACNKELPGCMEPEPFGGESSTKTRDKHPNWEEDYKSNRGESSMDSCLFINIKVFSCIEWTEALPSG